MEHTGTFVNNFLNTRKLSTHNLGKLFRLILFLFFSFVLFQNKAFAQSFTVSSPSITEGATGTTNATVVVSLSSAAPEGGKNSFIMLSQKQLLQELIIKSRLSTQV
jgi:hypothetical protein